MKFSRAAIAFYVGLVFASGVVLGVFGHRLYAVSSVSGKAKIPPEEYRKKVVAEYQSRLKLNDDQVTRLNMILDETRARIEETRQKMHPAYQKVREEQNEKFRSILTPDQVVEFEKMRKEREERQKQGGRGPGPGF